MRLAIDASRYQLPNPTGVEVYSNHIIDEIIRFSAKEDRTGGSPVPTGADVSLISPIYKKVPAHIPQIIIPGHRLWTMIRVTLFFIMHRRQVDALFVPSHTLPLILPKRSIITIHDISFRHVPEAYSLFQRLYLEFSTWWAVKFASDIIVPSFYTQKDLIHFYKCAQKKIHVIPHGFDSTSFLTDVPTKSDTLKKFSLHPQKYFTYVGRIEEKKNLRFLNECFLAAQIDANVKLVLMGKDGVGASTIHRLAEEKGKGRVIFTGYTERGEVSYLIQQGLGHCVPSKHEGFGIPVLEGFALEVPVIACNSAALPEVGGNAALYFEPGQAGSLVKILEDVVSEIFPRDVWVTKGKERLKDFSWKKCAEETWKILVKK